MNLNNKKKYLTETLSVLLLLVIIFAVVWSVPLDTIKLFISKNPILGGLTFLFLMILGTVVPPITIFPLIPFVSIILGSFMTLVYSVIGWTAGSIIAFLIARHLGRPFLAKYISLDKIDRWGNKIPEKNEFLVLVLLRIITPVDILSYAVGMFCRISLWKYSLASFVGVIPFSFVFAYGYDIFLFKDRMILFIALVMISIIGAGWFLYKRKFK